MSTQDSKPSQSSPLAEVTEEPGDVGTGSMRGHWKSLAACTLVSMCPFQYGIDFGLISGLQAMTGFLQVC